MNARIYISPRDLADILQVSESSVKRWADEGRIRATRTLGGHRRIAVSDAIDFVRRSGLPVAFPERLGLRFPPPGASGGAGGESPFLGLLEKGDVSGALRWVMAEHFRGRSLAELADGPIAEAFHVIGEFWKQSPSGILVEHRAVQICGGAIRVIENSLPDPAETAPLALGGAPSDDIYALPSLLLSASLKEVGFRTVNLGPDLPFEALESGLHAYKPSLIWLSFSCRVPAKRREEFEAQLCRLAKEAASWGGRLVFGGREYAAFERAEALPNVRALPTITDLIEFVSPAKAKAKG